MNKKLLSLALSLTVLALTACSSPSPAESESASSSGGSQSAGASQSQQPAVQTATLYIGMDGEFREYPLESQEEITPRQLVEGIAALTGWNLDLADEITDGKGGITVSFAETCALFSGPPSPQKDEFFVFDVSQLDQTILDSVKKTLQNWAVVPGLGDPDSVDIYFSGPDGSDLVLEGLEITIPANEPYRAFPLG